MAKDIIIVGFRVEEDNSVFYKKLKGIALGEVKDDAKLLSNFKAAIRVSDFVSVRIVEGKGIE